MYSNVDCKNKSVEMPKSHNDDSEGKVVDSLHAYVTNKVFLQMLIVKIGGGGDCRE